MLNTNNNEGVEDIVLINPDPKGDGLNEATIEPPLGLGYIAALVQEHNFTCRIIDANLLHLNDNEIIEHISPATKLIGIYLNSFSYNSVKTLASLIKSKRKNSILLLGGPLPSVMPEIILHEISCDGIIRGEGEYPVLRVITNLDSCKPAFEGNIPGLYYYNGENLVSRPAERIVDLDKLPFPSYELFPPLTRYKTRNRKSPSAAMITSRGCPFQCTFCSKDVFPGVPTFRSAENVLKEIEYLVKNFGIRQIDILDDNFTQDKKRLEAILDGIIANHHSLAINLQSGVRIEALDEAVLLKMKKAGVYKIAFGIESADEEVLKINKKRLDLKKLENIVRLAKRMNFLVYGFFVIGLPGETEAGFKKTMDFARSLDFDIANFCMAIPFVGTELYKMVEKNGRFLVDTSRNINTGFYGGRVFFEYGTSRENEISKRFTTAYKEFYNLSKQIKIILKIRSLKEAIWLIDAVKFVLKGLKGTILTGKLVQN